MARPVVEPAEGRSPPLTRPARRWRSQSEVAPGSSTPRRERGATATDGIVGQLIVRHVLTGVKALALLAPASRGFGLDAGSARAPQRAIVRRCRTPLPSRGEDDLGLCCTLIPPHRSVIRPQDSNHNPNHTAAVAPRPRKAPVCWIDRPPQQERPATRCAGRDAGSDPHETCGFAAQWAFLRHTHRRVAPGWILPSGEGGRAGVAARRSARVAAVRRRVQREADSYGTDGVSTCFARSPLRFDPTG